MPSSRDLESSSPREKVPMEGAEDGVDKTQWDAGLNNGLIYRPPAQAEPPDKNARPGYYKESSPVGLYAKAVGYAFLAIVPYLAVFDTLGHNKDFLPCNDNTCHYVRIFNSKDVPGTGINVMGVRNGVQRPVGLHYHGFRGYACPSYNKTRPLLQKLWGAEGHACPWNAEDDAELLAAPGVQQQIEKETRYARELTRVTKIAFYICKAPLWIIALPMNALAKTNSYWGMEHIPSGICPDMTYEEMQGRCNALNEENRKSKQRNIIHNPLRDYSLSRVGTIVGLLCYAILTAIHDVLLLRGVSETITLQVSFYATCSYGVAATLVFFWAMGAAEVFVAPALEDDPHKCMCYYQIPELTSLVALSTPFAMYVSFMIRVQMYGLAALFGDYLAYQSYIIPHYLGKQSFLWTWAVLCSPKMAGTIQGDPREGFSMEEKKKDPERVAQNWLTLKSQVVILYHGTHVVQLVVALSSSAFVIGFKELCVSLYLRGDMTPMVLFVIKWIVFPLPSIATLGVGILALCDLYYTTVAIDKGETFVDQATTMFPLLKSMLPKGTQTEAEHVAHQRKKHDEILGYFAFIIGSLIIFLWTWAVADGLMPDLDFMMGYEDLQRPKVAEAELWGACGFVFFFMHCPRLMSIAFSTWDDMESLRHLSSSAQGATGAGYKALHQKPRNMDD